MTSILPVSTLPTAAPPTPDPRGLGGLLAMVDGAERPLPLQSVSVRASIAGVVSRTVVTQTFHNPLENPVEAVHLFPLPDQGAIIALELVAGDHVVRAECKERKEAEQVFAEAREAGHRAALLTAERDDVHTLRVTRLPPGETVQVRIVVVQNLPIVDGLVRWRFPTVIAPRFIPGMPIGHSGPGISPDTDAVPDASRIQPPIRLQGGTSLDLQVDVAGPITSVASSLHAVQMQLDGGDVVVAPHGTATCDRDFVLAIGSGAPDALATRAWTDGRHTLALVAPPSVALPTPLPRDAIFVVDISGSMGGRKMEAARRALKTALHGLLPGDRFRLIAFDDRVHPATPDLVPYVEKEVQRADQWIAGLAERGGTQMYAPLLEALEGGTATPEDRLRTVLFITDGQAGDEARLANLVGTRAGRTRLFTLGIDTAVNGALLERLARLGGGTCELVTPRDDIEATVAKLEARFGSPILDQLGMGEGELAMSRAQAVFTGRPASLLVRGSAERVQLSGRSPEGAWSAEVVPRKVDFDLGPLWARRRVASLEDQRIVDPASAESVEAQVRALGLEYGIATRFTAFVAVERNRTVDGDLVEVVQPVEKPADWEMDLAEGAAPVFASQALPAPSRTMRRRNAPMKKKEAKGNATGWAPPPAPRGAKSRAALRSGGAPPPAAKPAPSPAAPMAEESASSGFFGRLARGLGFGGSAPGSAPPPPTRDEAFADAMPMERELLAAMDEVEEEEAATPVPTKLSDVGAFLAQRQAFDGGFGGVRETAAALLALLLLGHTRRTGVRQRNVIKAATWLEAHRSDPLVQSVLDALASKEAGEALAWHPDWDGLHAAGPEGEALGRCRR